MPDVPPQWRFRSLAIASAALSGCVSVSETRTSAQAEFFDRLSAHCGQAFGGGLVSTEKPDADMVGAPMVMHVRECSKNEIRIPFHVSKPGGGWDRSRTWVITRTSEGLRLKHDHRHEDGSFDKLTMYGGDTANEGTSARQEFPVDTASIENFIRQALPKSVTNIWAIEIDHPQANARRFAYELRRTGENARFFRVEFDLSKPVDVPQAPWGS